MSKAMKIGLCEWTLPLAGPYVCKFARELGYDGIQLFGGDYEKRFPISHKVTQDAYLEMAAAYQIEFASIAVRVTDYFSMFAPAGSEEHRIVRLGISKAVDAAAAMGVELVMVPNFVKSEVKTPENFHRLVSELQWACDYAADRGVQIAEENFMTVEDTKRLFAEVDRTNLRLYFDLQNYYLNAGMHTPDLVEPLLPYIVQVHAKDGKNKDLSGAPLGEGDVKLLDSMRELRRLGYTGWVVNENYYDVPPLVNEGDDPVALLKKDLATLRSASSSE